MLTTSTIPFNIWLWHHQLVLSGSYSKYALVIQPPCITDTRGGVFFHKWRFTELESVSYMDRISNFMATSLCHKSDHLIFWLTIDSHLVQVPCLDPTIFPILFSSSTLCITPCSNCYFSLPATLSTLIEGKMPSPAQPVATTPRISFSQSLSSAIFNSFAAFYFFPV